MKKVSVFFSVLVCILLLLCGAAYASEFEFSEGVITGYNGSDEKVVIPSSVDGKPVVAIGKDAFLQRRDIKEVVIPDGVTSIGDYAFGFCENIEKITVPDSVREIGDYAFGYSSGISEINIPDGVKHIGEGALISSCITSADIPDSVESIGRVAFAYCSFIEELDIPDSVGSIGAGAFSYCDNLKTVTIGTGVTSIGVYAFEKCPLLSEIVWNASDVADFERSANVFANSGIKTDGLTVTFGEGVKRIPDYAFFKPDDTATVTYETSLVKATFPDSLESIGQYAFSGCELLKEITVPEKVSYIGSHAFDGCKKLEKITWNAEAVSDTRSPYGYLGKKIGADGDGILLVIGDSVKQFPGYAFYSEDSMKLKTVSIGNGLSEVGDYAFRGCYSDSRVKVYYAGTAEAWGKVKINLPKGNIDLSYPLCYSYVGDEIHLEMAGVENWISNGYVPGSHAIPLSAVSDFVPEKGEFSGWYDNNEYRGSPVKLPYEGRVIYGRIVFPKTETGVEKTDDKHTFTVNTDKITRGRLVIIAVYNRGRLVDIKVATAVGDDIIFETEKEYTRVKVMAWGGFTDLSPCAVAESVE